MKRQSNIKNMEKQLLVCKISYTMSLRSKDKNEKILLQTTVITKKHRKKIKSVKRPN